MAKQNVRVKWTGDKQFVGIDSGKHSVVLSSHDDANHTGMRPSDLLLVSLAACTAYDVVDILKKKRINLLKLEIEVTSNQDPDPPWTFREIHLAFQLKGHNFTKKAIEQAIKLSLEKYCSVAATVSGKATITHSFQMEK